MNPEKLAQIQAYALGMAALLYEEAQATVPEQQQRHHRRASPNFKQHFGQDRNYLQTSGLGMM